MSKKSKDFNFDNVLGRNTNASKILAKAAVSKGKSNERSTKRKGRPVTLYLNTENYSALKDRAKEKELSVSGIIDELIEGYLENV